MNGANEAQAQSEIEWLAAPHADSPGALLGVWARSALTPNKSLAGRLAPN